MNLEVGPIPEWTDEYDDSAGKPSLLRNLFFHQLKQLNFNNFPNYDDGAYQQVTGMNLGLIGGKKTITFSAATLSLICKLKLLTYVAGIQMLSELHWIYNKIVNPK